MRHTGLHPVLIAAALVFLFLSGCEEVIQNGKLPYTEVLVIRGVLQDGQILDSLSVGRTLPYEEESSSVWDEEKQQYVYPTLESQVTNAAVTVTVNGIRYPLTHRGHGFYGNDTLVCRVGMSYTLHVEWNGKTAAAVTTVPVAPVIDSIAATSVVKLQYDYFREVEYHCTAFVRASTGSTLWLTAAEWDSTSYNSTPAVLRGVRFGSIVAKRTETDSSVRSRFELTGSITENSWNATIIARGVTVEACTFDGPMYRYVRTNEGGGDGGGSFSVDPVPVAWNVTGDAIGMFIGRSATVSRRITIH